MTQAALSNRHERLVIRGDLASASFLPWVDRHSSRLGLRCQALAIGPACVELEVAGQAELIDALEVGCLLGPFDVWVDTIERHPQRD